MNKIKPRFKLTKEELELENELFEAYKKNKITFVGNNKKISNVLKKAAENYIKEKEKNRKDKSITLRINSIVLSKFKNKASEMNIPYQTLIGNLLAEYVAH